ncbi:MULTISPECIES: hypothetical protein [Streptomyces]|uniref:Secreted protein n=3 Tax=Streptomyces TaxID=1883 RepID=A0ABD5JGT2_9ACTN|nr:MULTISPECIES: hypothetical protein [Streptomyces]KUL46844.1 hypothetical protein ADL28_33770 [Streptomyces violaceusniger]MEE4586863.1 hypothetical protein [Streptomyces sp. DSM 41602]QTI89014.1 hypothetical protein AS97_51135 [Streptomyces sp. AgN23]WTA83021.1 hypothetical protein OG751_25755 [Streptomyces antimycoticus]
MRGRLVIAAAALTMALTPGAAWAAQDGDDQTTGSHRPEASVSREDPRTDEGVPGYELVTLPNKNVPNFQRRTVYCPEGKKAIGGGAEARGNDAILVGSFPTDDGRGWIGLGRQTTTDNVGISVFVICAYV